MFDIIGDIHGFSKTLKVMLNKLGYNNDNGFYCHPKRKAVFVGDFIDRGKSIREVLQIVKSMVDNGSAYTVLGNHEYNAIAFNTSDNNGAFLREHSSKNIKQHKQTLKAFENNEQEWDMYISWFKTLPLYIEFENFNVIHACWDFEKIRTLKTINPENKITDDLLFKASSKDNIEFYIIETLLKGKEIRLPEGLRYVDKDGNPRKSIRFKWWVEPDSHTYRTIAVNYEIQVPDVKVPQDIFNGHIPYLGNQKPIFFGHYWKTGEPKILSKNACCVDYSIAKCKKLTAYRFDGEKKLDNKKFVAVNCID